MLKVLILKLTFLIVVIFGIQAMAHAAGTKTTTGIVNVPVSKSTGSVNLNSKLRRNLHFGGHGKNYKRKWPKK